MEEELRYFVAYLENIRKASHNTVMSYHSDLTKMIAYLHGQGMDSVSAVRTTHLNSYVLLLEKDGMAAATISRYIASMKGFFEYLFREHMIEEDPAFTLKPPKVEKKQPGILTIQEMEHLLAQTTEDTPKGCRDKAMLELLYATGMRASELISLRMEDVNLRFGWILCRDEGRERMIPFGGKSFAGLSGTGKRCISEERYRDSVSELLWCTHEPPGILESIKRLCGESWYRKRYYTTDVPSFLCSAHGCRRSKNAYDTGIVGVFRSYGGTDLCRISARSKE